MLNDKRLLLLLMVFFALTIKAQSDKVVAYIPSYRTAQVSKLNYSLVTHVMASFINPDENGVVSWNGNITNFVETVHANNAKACISIGGGGDYSWGSKVSIYENLLSTPESRTKFIHNIMNYVREHNIDGVDNDMEGQALALKNFNIFTQELADSVHAAGLELSAAIGVGGTWGENLFSDATLAKMDYIMTMSYGGVGSWNWQTKKDEQTFEKMKADMEHFTVKRNVPKEKVLGGIPFYSVEYPIAAQSNYNNFAHTLCATVSDPQFANQNPTDSDTLITAEGHVVYLNSYRTVKQKMDYCAENGGGIMIWEAGQDCFDGSFSMLDSMAAYKTAKSLSVTSKISEDTVVATPNPVIDNVQLNKQCNWVLLNSSGQVIKEGNGSQVPMSELPAGNYILKVKEQGNNQESLSSIKLVKQ